MSAAITPERIDSFWDEFVQHRNTDRGQWLTTNISWPYKTPDKPPVGGGNRQPSIYDDERLRRAIIRFARSYMPDRAAWEARLPRTGATDATDAPAALSEDDVLAILGGEDVLANALADLMRDDLAAWLRSSGFPPELAAAAARDCGDKLLPRGAGPTPW